MKIDYSKFKKVHSDKDSTTMRSDEGHLIRISHQPLSKKMKKQLESLPFAEGGEVPNEDEIIKKKESIDKANKENMEYGADQQEYPKDIQDVLAKTDITPRKMAEGGPVEESLPIATEAPTLPDTLLNPAPGAQFAASQNPITSSPDPTTLPYGITPEAMTQVPVQPSLAAPSLAPQPVKEDVISGPIGTNVSDTLSGYDKQIQGIQGEANAASRLGKEQAALLQDAAIKQKKITDDYTKHYSELDNERKSFIEDINNSHIDPNKYLGSRNTGQKIGTAIGLILGGIGSAVTGQENPAQKFLHDQINRDIEAQRADLGKKENLLAANMKQFGNLRDATDMTKIMQMDMVSNQLKQAAAKASSPMAQANALKAVGTLEMQIAPMMQQLSIRRALMSNNAQQGGSEGGGQFLKQDPAAFIPSVVPKEHQEAVYKEVERAQNTRQVANTALKNFDATVKQMKSAGGLGRIGTAVYSPAQLQALEAELGSTVGDQEGTVRETAMHNVKNAYLPRATDTDERISERRKELENYLKLKSSAPRAKSFGLDLDKFESSSRKPEARLSPQEQQMLSLARANPSHPNAQKILKKLGME